MLLVQRGGFMLGAFGCSLLQYHDFDSGALDSPITATIHVKTSEE